MRAVQQTFSQEPSTPYQLFIDAFVSSCPEIPKRESYRRANENWWRTGPIWNDKGTFHIFFCNGWGLWFLTSETEDLRGVTKILTNSDVRGEGVGSPNKNY